MGVTEELSNFVADLSFRKLPVGTVGMAKLATLDTLGVIFAGSREASSRVMVDFVRKIGGREEATVVGQGFKTHGLHAALVNGSLGHALDFDDTTTNWIPGTRGGLHAGAPVVSAAMAVSEMVGASGKDFITAVTAGYDIGARIAWTAQPRGQEGAWHPSGVFGTFAATAAAGKLLGFDTDQMVNAFGIAGSQASGILQSLLEGSPMKRLQSGFAARNGVLSALLTLRGIVCP
jgi:2-methylcitrate dehydratase PrpD